MALSILDGNQSATTLSTIVTSGQHIPAHTVVSLGTQAITDMRSAVSGSVVSVSSLPPISGTVTVGNSVTISSLPSISGTVTIGAGTAQIGSVTVGNSVTIGSLPNVKIQGFNAGGGGQYIDIGVTEQGAVPVVLDSALPAGTEQIGIVTANTFAVQGTAVTTSNFTSTTPSTVLASFNATREVLTIFNEGAGNLHICAGATCTTIAYQVRLSAGDYYEVPNHQTTITHSAVFATAGTARVTQVS
jgi:hypothetical protein